ncbi:hypothetical protein BDQ12DRAFT_21025 [Crucibulum laeve]|uniref:Uncharacterized protein n=1 Tax=Crucibulum laeve TaxID=68775 RepID=A0A5C3MGK7_9AGAR|nr:hypothetical protein BDQ12DRAFT_21025 [Crucibulum laeve]
MNDPPTHEDTINRGFNPRPPSMVERRFASPAPTFGTQYGAPGPAYGDSYSNYDNNSYAQGPYPSFGPGQVMHSTSPPPTANSANPLFPAPAHYGQSPFSPIASPTSSVGPYEPMYNERGEPIPSPYLTRQPSGARQPSPGYESPVDISRQMSTGAVYPAIARQPSLNNPHVDRNTPPANAPVPLTHENVPSDYVDLSRSSVSPFQAAQYAEISRKLNTEVPNGLDTPSVNQIMENHTISSGSSNSDRNLPHLPDREHESPFADPSLSVSSKNTLSPRPVSSESIGHELEFPTPPSPGPAMSSRYRVDSTPPTLPEIHLESRVSVSSYGGYDTPSGNNGPGPSPLGSGFPSGVSSAATVGVGRNLVPESPYINRFPITPSPLASSFGMPTPPVGRSFEASPPPSVHQPHTSGANGDTPVSTGNVTTRNTNPESSGKRPDTVYSMYDAEDAYGGI